MKPYYKQVQFLLGPYFTLKTILHLSNVRQIIRIHMKFQTSPSGPVPILEYKEKR